MKRGLGSHGGMGASPSLGGGMGASLLLEWHGWPPVLRRLVRPLLGWGSGFARPRPRLLSARGCV